MKRIYLISVLLLLNMITFGQNVGIGTTNPLSKLHIESGGLLITGSSGQTPVTGAGDRFMWIPNKSATRFGRLDSNGNTYWDEDSIGYYSFAAGKNARATGDSASISLGYHTNASGRYGSIALGDFANASGSSGASAIGGYVTASGISSIAIGQSSKAIGNYSQTIGTNSIASGLASQTLGLNDTAESSFSHAIGYRAITEGASIGNYALGYRVKSSGSSTVIGRFSDATGFSSFLAGASSLASGDFSHVFGRFDTASGANSIVVGMFNKGSSNFAKVFGNHSEASGNSSMALGAGVTSTGAFSVAIGNSSLASGDLSLTLGVFDTASGYYSGAIGYMANSTGAFSYSLGNLTRTAGTNSFSIGNYNTSSAAFSFSLGTSNRSIGQYGMATGYRNIQSAFGGFVTGLFNDTTYSSPDAIFPTNRIFQIGNGTSENDRSNAITVLQNGNVGLGILNPEHTLVVKDDIRLDAADQNSGTIGKSLRFGSNTTGEAIASKRTSGGNQWGLDFYTGNQVRLAITNGGTVQVVNNLTVQNGKGIIRSVDGTQQKKQVKIVTVNTSFAAGETKQFSFTWNETFGGVPDAYVGSVVSGSTGGWAEVIMTVVADNATGGTLFVYNPRSSSVNPNFSIKIVAIGPQ
jgi:hypothetical protein